jgi:hypothetical protein
MQKQEQMHHGDGSVMRTSGEKGKNYLNAGDAAHFNGQNQNFQHGNAKAGHWMKKKGDKSRGAGYTRGPQLDVSPKAIIERGGVIKNIQYDEPGRVQQQPPHQQPYPQQYQQHHQQQPRRGKAGRGGGFGRGQPLDDQSNTASEGTSPPQQPRSRQNYNGHSNQAHNQQKVQKQYVPVSRNRDQNQNEKPFLMGSDVVIMNRKAEKSQEENNPLFQQPANNNNGTSEK